MLTEIPHLEEPREPWSWWFAWRPVKNWTGSIYWLVWMHRAEVARQRRGRNRTEWVHVRPRLVGANGLPVSR